MSEIFAEGKSRIVYDLADGTVVKVPKTESGKIQGITEAKLYEIAEPTLKALLCPVLLSLPSGEVVMRKAERPENVYKASMFLMGRFRALGMSLERKDIHQRNVGIVDNKPVVIDYGSTSFRELLSEREKRRQ